MATITATASGQLEQIRLQALEKYKKALSQEDYEELQRNTRPEALIAFLGTRKDIQESSKFFRLLEHINNLFPRLEGYQTAIDVMAQAGGAHGCLIWGSIKIVISVSPLWFSHRDSPKACRFLDMQSARARYSNPCAWLYALSVTSQLLIGIFILDCSRIHRCISETSGSTPKHGRLSSCYRALQPSVRARGGFQAMSRWILFIHGRFLGPCIQILQLS